MVNNLLDESARNDCILICRLKKADDTAVVDDNDERKIRSDEGVEGFNRHKQRRGADKKRGGSGNDSVHLADFEFTLNQDSRNFKLFQFRQSFFCQAVADDHNIQGRLVFAHPTAKVRPERAARFAMRTGEHHDNGLPLLAKRLQRARRTGHAC